MPDIHEELIIKYLKNSLTENEEKDLLVWIQLSDENRETFLNCKKIFTTRKINYYSQPLVLNQALRNFNERKNKLKKEKNSIVYKQIFKYAAFALVIACLSYFARNILSPSKVEKYTVYVNETEPVKRVTLIDGTIVWLNNRSSLTYPERFDKANRNVSILGEAYFEVKTDSTRPFIVEAGNIRVKVCGTAFNINTNTTDTTVKTTLVTGRVSIFDSAGNSLKDLVPGQLASYRIKARKLDVTAVNPDLYTVWHKGMVVFDKATMKDIIRKIEELYQVHITINDRSEFSSRVNFVFRKDQKLETVMEMLSFVVPINYKFYGNQIYINMK